MEQKKEEKKNKKKGKCLRGIPYWCFIVVLFIHNLANRPLILRTIGDYTSHIIWYSVCCDVSPVYVAESDVCGLLQLLFLKHARIRI